MYLDVGNGHTIYFEDFGNPHGIKILFLHGGPGLGFSENDKAFFDPEKFYVVFIDQRGCGKSKPKGELRYNTTQDLVEDVRLVLDYLDIESVSIFGGSWGATLAILVAAKYPERVDKLILRGFFSATRECANIYLQGGIKATHPKNWERVSSFASNVSKEKLANFYFESISQKRSGFRALGYEWARYGLSLSRKQITEEELDQILILEEIDLDRILIELNYALHEFFIPEGYVYAQAAKIEKPVVVIHGMHDYICPIEDAKKLNAILHESELIIVDAGHSTAEKAIKEALFKELDKLN